MRIPKSLEALVEDGVIEEVIRPLMSGKEAQIYMVVAEGYYCAAKIYKEAQNRSFKNKADYTEGRKVRNSRDQRAIAKGTKYGKKKDEDTWKVTEVEMIYRLRDAGVRVPEPYVYIDGVLVMELVVDPNDSPAPRLGELQFSPQDAKEIYDHLIHETARMLCAGVVHGDLSEFNVLLAADGPVIIDFPQAVNAASNQNARSLLIRDVNNLHRFVQRWVPGARRLPYAEEMWSLYENNRLTPETRLTGNFKGSSGPVDTRAVLGLIADANRDEMRRRSAEGRSTAGIDARTGNGTTPGGASTPARRREYIVEKPAPRGRPQSGPQNGRRNAGGRPRDGAAGPESGWGGQGGRRTSGGGRGPGPDRGRSDGSRSSSTQRSHKPQGKSVMPKRGDHVQASSYVSPEARKTNVKKLTPRGDGSSHRGTSSEGGSNARVSGGGRRSRRPRRRR